MDELSVLLLHDNKCVEAWNNVALVDTKSSYFTVLKASRSVSMVRRGVLRAQWSAIVFLSNSTAPLLSLTSFRSIGANRKGLPASP